MDEDKQVLKERCEAKDWQCRFRKRGDKEYCTVIYSEEVKPVAWGEAGTLIRTIFPKAYMTSGGPSDQIFRIN
jgi:hypothetical protein